jgi:hypothetical protein
MIITKTAESDGTTLYSFRYLRDGNEKTSELYASAQGIKSPDGHVASCNDQKMVSKTTNEAGSGTINFINARGDYEAVNNGQTQIICTRQKK